MQHYPPNIENDPIRNQLQLRKDEPEQRIGNNPFLKGGSTAERSVREASWGGEAKSMGNLFNPTPRTATERGAMPETAVGRENIFQDNHNPPPRAPGHQGGRETFSMQSGDRPTTLNTQAVPVRETFTKTPSTEGRTITEDYNTRDTDTRANVHGDILEKDKKIQELEFQLKQMVAEKKGGPDTKNTLLTKFEDECTMLKEKLKQIESEFKDKSLNLQKLEFERFSYKDKLNNVQKYEGDIKDLSLKLKQESEKNEGMINKLYLLKESKEEGDETISELTKELSLLNKSKVKDTEIISQLNEDLIFEKQRAIKNKVSKKTSAKLSSSIKEERGSKYKNPKLKGMISKYVKDVSGETIDDIFIKMKIDENATITKELISRIISEIKQ